VKKSGIAYTILRPNNFYQNDFWFRDAILNFGIYPQPYGDIGMSRVDVRDIAEAAAITLTESGYEGQTLHIAGPEVLTGSRTAEIWSEALGRQVDYQDEDMDAWEEQVRGMLPDEIAFDYRLMFEFFQRHGCRATTDELDRVAKLLGHEPRRYEDFVRETAVAWLAQSSQNPGGVNKNARLVDCKADGNAIGSIKGAFG
jgi:uncharacterized protein YbjT (DUF2867 family)